MKPDRVFVRRMLWQWGSTMDRVRWSRPAWARGLKLLAKREKALDLGRAPRGRVD